MLEPRVAGCGSGRACVFRSHWTGKPVLVGVVRGDIRGTRRDFGVRGAWESRAVSAVSAVSAVIQRAWSAVQQVGFPVEWRVAVE